MDGTFKCAPSMATQIYAIHGSVYKTWVPLVIALLERKTKTSYKSLFDVLKTEVQRRFNRQLDPPRVSTDYETAAISAAQESFPGTIVSGCLFHLGQSFWRKLQTEGLTEEYRREANEELRADFHSLIALAFVPEEDVIEAFESLAASASEELQPVLDHVEDNYVRGRRRGRGRTAPAFPPSIWSCYDRALEGLPRSTNTAEAWHRRLNSLVGKHHPSLFTLIHHLQEEVAQIDVTIDRAEGGESPPAKKAKHLRIDERIPKIVERYQEYKDDDDVLGYLRALGHNVAGNF